MDDRERTKTTVVLSTCRQQHRLGWKVLKLQAQGESLKALSHAPEAPLSQANQQHLHLHLQAVDLISSFNNYLNALESTHTATKALPSGQDPEAAQTTNSTEAAEATQATEATVQAPEAAERCAREEKPAQKES